MVDFSINFNDPHAKRIADFVESDNKKGISCTKEVIDFIFQAREEGIDEKSINELFGLSISNRKKIARNTVSDTFLTEIVNYFNSLDYFGRSNIISLANELGRERLYLLEKEINQDFEECEAYKLIKLRPDRFEDKIRFDMREVHDDVETAMKSLNELRDKLQYAYEKASGETQHTTPQMTEYDLDKICEKYFGTGMTFEKVMATYDLDFTKSTTINDLTPEQKILYDKARAYVREIKKLAREEAQNLRYDNSERLLNETVEYSNSAIEMVDFEDEDYNITEDSIRNLSSGIMRAAFIDAVCDKATGLNKVLAKYPKGSRVVYDKNKNQTYIETPDGSMYNLNGVKIK